MWLLENSVASSAVERQWLNMSSDVTELFESRACILPGGLMVTGIIILLIRNFTLFRQQNV